MKSEIFYGKVQIGDSGLYLSDEILEKFSYKGYINLENQPEKLLLEDLQTAEAISA